MCTRPGENAAASGCVHGMHGIYVPSWDVTPGLWMSRCGQPEACHVPVPTGARLGVASATDHVALLIKDQYHGTTHTDRAPWQLWAWHQDAQPASG